MELLVKLGAPEGAELAASVFGTEEANNKKTSLTYSALKQVTRNSATAAAARGKTARELHQTLLGLKNARADWEERVEEVERCGRSCSL